jgi:hypothetical protein
MAAHAAASCASIRVAHEDEALAGLVGLDHERAEAGDVGGGVAVPTCWRSVPAFIAPSSLCFENRQGVEQPQAGAVNGAGT